MKLYRQGDKFKAICSHCERLVETTFSYRDIPFSDAQGIAKDILVAVCDTCNAVVAIPSQSTPAIAAARETSTKPIEVNLPASMVETLDLAAFRIDPRSTAEFRKRLLAYYIHLNAGNNELEATIAPMARNAAIQFDATAPKKRLSFKVSPRLRGEMDQIARQTKLNKTDIIKGLVMQIDRDIIQPDQPANLPELQRLAAVAAA